MSAIVFSDITKEYTKGIVALNNFSATIPYGKTVGFIGANGSGKTTALKLLAGLIKPTKGTIDFLGVQPNKEVKKIRKKVGYVAQNIGLDPESTGKETLSLFAALYGINGTAKKIRIQELIDDFELTTHINQRVKTYSGGLKQRLHLAIGLMHNPDYVLLDEPTTSLDPRGKQFVWNTIIHNKNCTTIIVTHDLQEATKHCDHVIFFDKGKMLTQGSPEEIINANKLETWQIHYSGTISFEVKKSLKHTEGTYRVSISKSQLLLSIDNNVVNENNIISILEKTIEIIEIRKQKPNLSTAYFSMTGYIADKQVKKSKKNKRKR